MFCRCAQTGIDKKQALVEAQDAARNNPAFQPERGPDGKVRTTHCNEATADIVATTGASTAPLVNSNGQPLPANQQAANLAKSPDYKQVSPAEAQQSANTGGVALAAQSASGHGHIATVRPEGVPGDNPIGKSGPLINNIGGHNDIRRQSAAFLSDRPVLYYIQVQP